MSTKCTGSAQINILFNDDMALDITALKLAIEKFMIDGVADFLKFILHLSHCALVTQYGNIELG